jgi:predicted acetyltransferase
MLADEVLELHLLEHDPARHARLFAIHLRDTGVEVGKLILRLDRSDPGLQAFAGHIAFEIAPEHRGHAHARRACLLLCPLAREHGFTELWLTAAPDNLASRRTIERLGADHIDTVAIPDDSDMRQLGYVEVCRYRWRID